MVSDIELFSMSMGHLYVLLGEMSIQVFCPCFDWIVCFTGVDHISSLYILEIKPLSDVSLANMFSHTVSF